MNKMDENNIKVLLIEDDPADTRLFRKMLTGEPAGPFVLQSVETLSEGLNLLESTHFDVVLLGNPALKTVEKMHTRTARVPIVVLTGQADETLSINALKHGAQDYLIKENINARALRRCLRYAIERKQIQNSLWIKDRVIESSIDPIAITDLKGRLTYANRALLDLWQYERNDQVLGKSIEQFWFNTPRTLWILEAVSSNGSWIGKVRGKKSDGTDLDLQLSAFAVKEKDNLRDPLCMVFSFVDVSELTQLRRRLKTEQSFAGIVGRDVKMLELLETIRELAEVDVPVLIQGESGTGKELVAAAIHNEGPDADKPFVPVNCGALPEGVLESELFGHVKGAFTGAVRDRKGRFELANGGTIFLDEIADVPPLMQVKLLRVLQEGSFHRVGDEHAIKVNVRVISATNKNLAEQVAAGRFREDLFYRLCVVPVYVPCLRERRNDIPLLAEHLLNKALTDLPRRQVVLSSEAVDAMMDYDWPGNVRELENAIRYALVKCRNKRLLPEHLPAKICRKTAPRRFHTRKKRRRKLDSAAVFRALEQTAGNKLEAAIKLGVSRATLYRFLQECEQTTAKTN